MRIGHNQRIFPWYSSKLWLIFIAYSIITITASTQIFLIKGKHDRDGSMTSKYGNYLIFKYSYYHLIQGKDLYQKYPQVCGDLFKYSPSFALLFGSLAYLPDAIGLNFWNLLNTLLLFYSIIFLPGMDNRQKGFILLFILIELITSLQNSQSNALMAGLMLFAFGLLERKKFMLATLCIMLTVYIKIFGVFALVIFALYPEKRKLFLYTTIWFLLLLVLPVFVVGIDQLVLLYKSWYTLLITDNSASIGLSVSGFIKVILPSAKLNSSMILLVGSLLLLVPLIRFKQYKNYHFRLLVLSSVLIWVVIFNNKAESPTYIIAMTGVAVWFFSQEKRTENLVLLIIAFILTSMSPTDFVPGNLRDKFITPFCMKAFPCILIWIKITLELLCRKDFPAPLLLPDREPV